MAKSIDRLPFDVSVSSASDNGSTSEYEEIFDSTPSPCSSSTVSTSILDKLRAPKASDLTRKRKVFRNSVITPRQRKKRPACASNPKSVSPVQRAKEFEKEGLVVSAGKLFCEGCREEVSLKKSIIKNHIRSSKHAKMIQDMKDKNRKDADIVKCLSVYDEEVHPSGETLPEKQRLYRIKVVSAFLRAGVPLNKIEVFRDVFEEHGYRLACRRTMSDNIPFIHTQEVSLIKKEISQKNISVIFDGTTRLGEAFAIVIRFLDNFEIKQRLIRLQLLVKSLTGEEIARKVVHTLSAEYGVTGNRLMAAMHDRAAANGVAMRTIQILFPDVVSVGCYSHTIDHVGEHFNVPHLQEFSHLWLSLFSHSPRTRLEWRNDTGRAMASFSNTRWWSRWEVYSQILTQFGDVQAFLEQHSEMAPNTRAKL